MDATELIKIERGIYYAALNALASSDAPRELWPMLLDSATGRLKDETITTLAMRVLEGSQQDQQEGDDDGEHPAGD